MSSQHPFDRLKDEHRKIEEELERLREEKKRIDQTFSSIMEEERRLIEDLRRCRDAYEYSRMEMRLNMVSRSRREAETEKNAIERKIRGYEVDLGRIGKRIAYLKPG